MSNFPNFSSHGYRVNKELGSNRAGGRITYLATNLATLDEVVIKQFQFAISSSQWSDYDLYEREIQVLQGLDHPGICRYLSSFQTKDGFCMVQEYKNALPLSVSRSFSLQEVEKIAICILEILAYLQNRIPPVIHRDIKPENILVDDHINVYIIDFGFARVGHGEVGVSSVVKGTLGFMPPEQLFNRQLTEASDLYGLGITLICLLTGTKSIDVGNLVDITYRINFKHLIPKINLRWVNWLEKMVDPRLKDRYPDAASALADIPKTPIYLPEARFNRSELVFKATQSRENLTQTISIDNPIPGTLLQGFWEVVPHPSDPHQVHNIHSWISFQPAVFEDNHTQCQITIDVSRLIAGKIYRRELLLHANSSAKRHFLLLQVQTASIQTRVRGLPYGLLVMLFLFAVVLAWVFAWAIVVVSSEPSIQATFAVATGASIGFEIAAWIMAVIEAPVAAATGVTAGVMVGLLAIYIAATENLSSSLSAATTGALIGLTGGVIAGVSTGVVAEALFQRGSNQNLAVCLSLLTTGVATSIGVGLTVGFLHPLLILIVASTGLPLVILSSHLPLKRVRILNRHRKLEQHLIKP
jgi:serine/threonine protein kinase